MKFVIHFFQCKSLPKSVFVFYNLTVLSCVFHGLDAFKSSQCSLQLPANIVFHDQILSQLSSLSYCLLTF